MKKTIWISSVVALALILAIGSAMARKYKRHHFSRGAILGVETQSVDKDLAEIFELSIDYGAIVNDVIRRSPAYKAGIEEDDVIIAIDGSKVRDSYDLSELLEEFDAGEEVMILVMRDGDQQEISVALGERSDFFGIVAPRAPRAPRAPKAPQAYWFSDNHAYMGVSMMDLTRQLGEYFGVDKARGALITEVERSSPAEEAGLQAGDVIVRLDDERVFDYEDVREIVSDSDPGDKLAVVVVRDKSEVSLEVTLDERDHGVNWRDSYGFISTPELEYIDQINAHEHHAAQREFSEHLKELRHFRGLRHHDGRELDAAMQELHEEMQELQEELKEELHGLGRRVQ